MEHVAFIELNRVLPWNQEQPGKAFIQVYKVFNGPENLALDKKVEIKRTS